jgi:hypothetical protein
MRYTFTYFALLACAALSVNAGENDRLVSDHDQVILVQQAPIMQKPETPLNPAQILSSLQGLGYPENTTGEKLAKYQIAHKKELARSHSENKARGAGFRAMGASVEKDAQNKLKLNDAAGYRLLHAAGEGLIVRGNAYTSDMTTPMSIKLEAQKENDVLAATTQVKTPDGKTHDLSNSRESKRMIAARSRALARQAKRAEREEREETRAAKKSERVYTPTNPRAK